MKKKPYTFFDDPVFDGLDLILGRRIFDQLLSDFMKAPEDKFLFGGISYKVSDVINENTIIGVSEAGRAIVAEFKKACLEESS